MKQVIITPLLLVLLAISGQVFAVGLGDIQLESRLNQRLKASIPVLVSADTDAEELTVKLAGREHFKRAGLERDANVLSISFTPRRVNSDQMIIEVSTNLPVREPMLRFIVEVEHNGSKALREYTTFLNTPGY